MQFQHKNVGVLPFLAGGGEMGERIRAFDWSATPLGPASEWPSNLRSAVSIMLLSKAQIVLFWGPDYVTLYNDAYRPVFGAKHPAALGQLARNAWSEIWDSTLRPLFDGVVNTSVAFSAHDLLFVLERNGFPEEAFFDVSYDPVRNEDGRVEGLLCIVSETTGRVVGERRLKTLRELGFRTATEATDDAGACANAASILNENRDDILFSLIYLLDDDARAVQLVGSSGIDQTAVVAAERVDLVQNADPAWPFADVLMSREARTVTEVRHHDDAPPTAAVVLPIVKVGQDGLAGFLIVGTNPRCPFDEQYRAFLDLVANQLATLIGNARAYAQERQRAQELAELDRVKTAFFSNVSHEFRTPITLMLGPLAELLTGQHTAVEGMVREQLEVVNRNGLRLLRLVNTLLDFSRLEAGRMDATFCATDLSRATTDLASVFRSAVEKAGLSLTVSCDDIGEPVFIDSIMWEKIVLNLLSNAFKFTFDGGITVTLRRDDRHAELRVIDTGTGIPDTELPRLFERFHRVENARGRTHEGSGIGLALVQELVRLHGGSVDVSSALGRGTTFIVRIPLGTAHLAHDRITGEGRAPGPTVVSVPYVEEALRWLPAGPSTEVVDFHEAESVDQHAKKRDDVDRVRILVADDNADMRQYLTRLLSERFSVEAVGDGEAALASVHRKRPDLIVADVMMPKLDGYGLLRAVRGDELTRDVPIIMLSARAGEDARVEGLNAGADDYLVKPFGARELIARVESSIALARVRADADQRKDEFLATLAHELRNPLAPLRNMLEVLRRTSNDPHLTEHARAVMERQVASLTRLVDDLLDVSRITRNKLELRRETADLGAILQQATETCRSLAEEMAHTIDLKLPRSPVWLNADPVRLAQVFANLLNNACKYTPRGGTIGITVVPEEGRVRVHIRDTGYGIPRDMLARVFDLFTQVDQSRENAQGGLGIGLTLVKRLVEMHDGFVTAHSDGAGTGSEFIVTLPVFHVPHEATRKSGLTDVAPVDRLRVLVVDDNVDSADSLAMLLQAVGHETHSVHDGLAAVEAVASFKPDIVLLDIGMPRMNGHEACKRIRALPGLGPMTVIALTGWGQDHDREMSRAAGFDGHLVKPVSFEDLAELLKRPLPRWPAPQASGAELPLA